MTAKRFTFQEIILKAFKVFLILSKESLTSSFHWYNVVAYAVLFPGKSIMFIPAEKKCIWLKLTIKTCIQ